MSALETGVRGIGCWQPGHGGWPELRAWLRGEATAGTAPPRPPASILAAGERRRAPPTVLLACEAAAQACAMASLDPAQLPCVFASAHGEVAISHEMCATLATDPRALSPTRFHNSVHNAAVGYWTLATQCHAASSALSAGPGTLAAGLFEAAALACAEQQPVLLAHYEAAADGPLAQVLGATTSHALALVLTPAPAQGDLRLRLCPQARPAATPADNLALLTALARAVPTRLELDAGGDRHLQLEILG